MISTAVEVNGTPINVILMDLDTIVEENVHDNADGSYTVILNSRFTHKRMMESFDHAIEHIRNKDFGKEDVQAIEAQAHGIQVEQKEEIVPEWKRIYEANRPKIEKELKRIRRQLKQYERRYNRMSLWDIEKENERNLRIYEDHKADPDYRF